MEDQGREMPRDDGNDTDQAYEGIHLKRRQFIKGAVITGAAVAGASYITPTLRSLSIPVAHASGGPGGNHGVGQGNGGGNGTGNEGNGKGPKK